MISGHLPSFIGGTILINMYTSSHLYCSYGAPPGAHVRVHACTHTHFSTTHTQTYMEHNTPTITSTARVCLIIEDHNFHSPAESTAHFLNSNALNRYHAVFLIVPSSVEYTSLANWADSKRQREKWRVCRGGGGGGGVMGAERGRKSSATP